MVEDTQNTGVTPTDPLAAKLDAHWREARAWAAHWREEAREDRRFYDGHQWTPEEIAELKSQRRPATVINQVFKAVNNLIGRERESRLDWKVQGRGASDVKPAAARTKALKYLGDQTRARYALSQAFKDAVKGPMGWVEVAIDDTDPSREPLVFRHVPWDQMYFDKHWTQPDLDDARYVIRSKWTDLELAESLARSPEAKEALKQAVAVERDRHKISDLPRNNDYGNRGGDWSSDFEGEPDWCDAERKRVRLREHWYWEREKAKYIVYPDGRSILFDPADPQSYLAAYEPGGQIVEGTRRKYYWAIVAGMTVLDKGESPYPFDAFPFVPVWCYVDDEGRPFGVIRMMKDPQRELNVARSRFNESIRSRWIVYRDGSLGKLNADEVARRIPRSNFVLGVADPSGIQIGHDKADGQFWLGLMETARREIDDVAGQNEASYGDKSNERSAKAIQTRIGQQGLNFGEIWDNLRFARLLSGERALALIGKFYHPAKLIRITEAAMLREDENADTSWLGQAYADNVVQDRYDVVLEDVAETTTERQAALAQRIELIGMVPDPIKPFLIPGALRMTNDPDKDEVATLVEQMLQMQMGAMMAPQVAPAPPADIPPEAGPAAPPV